MASARYVWSTGPISSSLGLDNTRVVVLNNSSLNQKVYIRLYDLNFGPKKRVYTETIYMDPSVTVTVDIPAKELELWEVQAITFSKRVQVYVSGREENMNLVGNTVLYSELTRL